MALNTDLTSTEKEDEQAPPPEGMSAEGEGEEGSQNVKPVSKKRLIIILVALVIACSMGVGGFVMWKHHQEEVARAQDESKQQDAKQEVFHDMDEIIVNLNTENKAVSFMKMTVTLNIEGKENLDVVKKLMPRIRDVFQIYLRELRPADLQGSVGLYRLREELLLRINKLVYPAQVKDILFKEVLVQ